jgi:hypothetical protein
MMPVLEAAPDGLNLAEVLRNLNVSDTSCPCPGRRRSICYRGRHGHCKTCLWGNIYTLKAWSTFAKK